MAEIDSKKLEALEKAFTGDKLKKSYISKDNNFGQARIEPSERSNKHERKQKRLAIAKLTIILCFWGLGIIFAMLTLILLLDYFCFGEVCSAEVETVIQAIQFLGASLFSVLTMAFGFVAGSSIE